MMRRVRSDIDWTLCRSSLMCAESSLILSEGLLPSDSLTRALIL